MAKPVLHQHAFWVYGVIVGLALKEALSTVLPHLLGFLTDLPQSPFAYLWEVWKLTVFLTLIIQFYLGSAVYFNRHHNLDSETLSEGYVPDFLAGLIHFILFFAWSLTFKVG